MSNARGFKFTIFIIRDHDVRTAEAYVWCRALFMAMRALRRSQRSRMVLCYLARTF